ncbi:hypothetical protein BJV78DRAFT_1198053 [Lactifluus subvellereus]|nr:hypothetical protein BJV78DRAFT_1198053 [Lactifluus subvellereus]
MGESRRDGRDRGNTPIIVSVRRRGERPARNMLGSMKPVVLFSVTNGGSDAAAAIDCQVESGARRTRK